MKYLLITIISILAFQGYCQTDFIPNESELDTCIKIFDIREEEKDSLVFNKVCNCLHIDYLPNGFVYRKGVNNNCKPEGEWREYGDSNKVIRIINYKQGVRHGKFVAYWNNGNISIEEEYYEGQFDKISRKFDLEGNLIEEKIFDKGNMLEHNVIKEWDLDGAIQYEWPSDPTRKKKNRLSGVYIWNDGQIFLLREFNENEISSGTPDYELNKVARSEFIGNLKTKPNN